MANHKSSKKRIRQIEKRRLFNRYYSRTARNAVRDLRAMTNKDEAKAVLPKVASLIDRLAKKNVIHDNKASNLKSKLTKFVNKL
jgi:small subunit ribosomal protein S20